ncbi:diphthine methyltransferase [Cylas formicarius]|uniref:diphthine methyltransferase n=1 Tax=Cylas formicarius TaxID=197179 RepID=UPI00295869FF|nr:diphthine methyltransferase [Cylas formicarius]
MTNKIVSSQQKCVNTIYTFSTEYTADCIEWCPHNPNKHLFVCGNYQYTEPGTEENTLDKRLGRILLFSISPHRGLEVLQQLDTAGVLDIKWCHNQICDVSLLGIAGSEKTVDIYQLKINKLINLTHYKFRDIVGDTIVLSLDWSTGKYESSQPNIVCSDSNGKIHLFRLLNSGLNLEKSWNAHDFQAWISAFYYWDPNIIFSGGDDALFLQFDKRVGDIPVTVNKKHETGVTAVHSNKSNEYVIATGSYDESVRLWDIRSLKTPQKTLKMPGPVWKLKWDPFSQELLLSACMLGGVHVINPFKNEMEITHSYYEHANISYGVDWCHLDSKEVEKFDQEGAAIIGTCSFYDRLLCVSKLSWHFNA